MRRIKGLPISLTAVLASIEDAIYGLETGNGDISKIIQSLHKARRELLNKDNVFIQHSTKNLMRLAQYQGKEIDYQSARKLLHIGVLIILRKIRLILKHAEYPIDSDTRKSIESDLSRAYTKLCNPNKVYVELTVEDVQRIAERYCGKSMDVQSARNFLQDMKRCLGRKMSYWRLTHELREHINSTNDANSVVT